MAQPSEPLADDLAVLKELLAGKDALIGRLIEEITRLRRWRFGRSAERIDETINPQLPLDNISHDPELAPDTSTPARSDQLSAPVRTHPDELAPLRTVRALPPELPRQTVLHRPASCQCRECGARMRLLGEDISEMLDYVQGHFQVIRHVRPKLSCVQCSKVVHQPAAPRPIERGLPTAGLLSHVLVSKYADHCPLYRQQGIYRRAGLDLDRATLASWVGQSSQLMDPLVNALGRYVLSAQKIHADDTPVPVLEPGRGRTRTGRLWTYVRDDRPCAGPDPPAVWYRFSPDRKGQHPRDHLRSFRGICRRMRTPASRRFTQGRGSSRRPAGRTLAGSSMMCMSLIGRRLQVKRSDASASFTTLSVSCAATRLRSGTLIGKSRECQN